MRGGYNVGGGSLLGCSAAGHGCWLPVSSFASDPRSSTLLETNAGLLVERGFLSFSCPTPPPLRLNCHLAGPLQYPRPMNKPIVMIGCPPSRLLYPRFVSGLVALAVGIGASVLPNVHGQAVPANATKPAPDSAVVLSPFEVVADPSDTYQALNTSSISGTN